MNDDEPEKNTYTCLTKNRMFCWDCGRYYGSSH